MNRPLLYAEDDENDVFLMRRALQKIALPCALQVVSDGRSAADYLKGVGAFSDRTQFPQPSLVLLDLKMPEMSGLEVLNWARKQPELDEIPIVLFSSSTQPTDIIAAHQGGANGYFIKPGAPKQLQDLLSALRNQVFDTSAPRGWWKLPLNQDVPSGTVGRS